MKNDEHWMQHAIILARYAELRGEIPVGTVLVINDNVIGEGWNCSIINNDPTAHAEILALRQGGKNMKNYRLLETTLYVTLEPCIMCATAMIHARINRLVFGTKNKKNGAAGSIINIFEYPGINHKISLTSGILSKFCSEQLNNFFSLCRLKKNNYIF